ncbi:MAG: NAD-dependent epimerase/dehydratase family protein [Actinomycetota bacterium]|nr:NAD-dependent epimerase/dehydratase family protein [Actinomycetota bacterium]
MNIVLTGATGYIGSATLKALLAHGHDVTALVRSEESARAVQRDGVTPVVGDITDVAWMAEKLRSAEGAIHLATTDDGEAMDDAVASAVLKAFPGTEKPYVHTGGVWVWGTGDSIVESDPQRPPKITSWRGRVEQRILTPGIRGSVVAPAIVYGYGAGIPKMTLVDAPTTDGKAHVIGDGTQHWATVHVDDLAELYVAVLEKAPGGDLYIGASGSSPTVLELAEALNGVGNTRVETPDESRGRLGADFADALLLSQQATGSTAKNLFSWSPTRPSLVELLRDGYPGDR